MTTSPRLPAQRQRAPPEDSHDREAGGGHAEPWRLPGRAAASGSARGVRMRAAFARTKRAREDGQHRPSGRRLPWPRATVSSTCSRARAAAAKSRHAPGRRQDHGHQAPGRRRRICAMRSASAHVARPQAATHTAGSWNELGALRGVDGREAGRRRSCRGSEREARAHAEEPIDGRLSRDRASIASAQARPAGQGPRAMYSVAGPGPNGRRRSPGGGGSRLSPNNKARRGPHPGHRGRCATGRAADPDHRPAFQPQRVRALSPEPAKPVRGLRWLSRSASPRNRQAWTISEEEIASVSVTRKEALRSSSRRLVTVLRTGLRRPRACGPVDSRPCSS